MTDTHAHLDACDEDAGELVARARHAGVDRIVTIGTGIESCRRAVALAERYDGVFATVGIDPHRAATAEALRVDELRSFFSHPRVVAVGEAGLDGHYGRETMREQRTLLVAQLALAEEARLPVVIHCREAAAEILPFLEAFTGPVVLHCFSEPALLAAALEHGWYASFAGNLTYRSAAVLREAAASVSADRLLVETDSPYLAPVPLRGRRNEPAYLVHTLEALADARGADAGDLAATTDANAARVFGLP